jgi:PRC-barrel domain
MRISGSPADIAADATRLAKAASGKLRGMSELPHERLFGDYGDWPGRDVLDSGGDRLGGVREIYLDRETGRPEWVLVEVENDQPRFVPLADASVESTAIRVAHAASVVHAAPAIGPDTHIDNDQERRLYAHYGIDYSEAASDSGLPADVTVPPDPATEPEGDVPPEDLASAEAAAAGAGPAAAGMAEPADEAEPPAEVAPPEEPDEGPLWSEVDAPAPPMPPDAAPGEETPGLPPSGLPEPPAFATPEPPATPGLPEPPQPEAGPDEPPAPVPEPPPPPSPPAVPEGSARRPAMAAGAAVLALLLFLLVRRLRN